LFLVIGVKQRVGVIVNNNATRVSPALIGGMFLISDQDSFYVTKRPNDLPEIVEKLVEMDTIFFVGGDGTVTSGIQALQNLRKKESLDRLPRIACAKAGNGNAIAHDLGGARPLRMLEYLLKTATADVPTLDVPLLEVKADGDTSYCTFAGMGWDAGIIKKYDQRKKAGKFLSRGLSGYLMAALLEGVHELWNNEAIPIEMQTKGRLRHRREDGSHEDVTNIDPDLYSRVIGINVMEHYGYGLRAFPYAAEAREEGLAQLRIAHGESRLLPLRLAFNWRRIFAGTYQGFEDYRADHLQFSADKPFPVQIAGDLLPDVSSLEIEVSREARAQFVKYQP